MLNILKEEEELENETNYYLYFCAKWCRGCPEFENKIEFELGYRYFKVDVDKHPDLTVQYKVEKIPSLKKISVKL